jgi:hypothetical protein
MFEHPDPNQYELGKDSFDPEGKLSYQNLRQVLLNPCDRIKFNSNETHDTYMASIGMVLLGLNIIFMSHASMKYLQ